MCVMYTCDTLLYNQMDINTIINEIKMDIISGKKSMMKAAAKYWSNLIAFQDCFNAT